jgi:hypothetical protein
MDGTETVTSFQRKEDEWIFLENAGEVVASHVMDVLFHSLIREEVEVEEPAKKNERDSENLDQN